MKAYKKIMLKLFLLLVMALCPLSRAFSQSKVIEEQINAQVWKPFIESYSTRDDKALSSVHSKDFIRVLRDNDKIYGFDEAFKVRPDSIQRQWAIWKRSLELRFVERIVSEDKAFEIGYYKTSSTNTSTGEKRVSYGKFHVLLRKENGVWKILMDADGHEDINEEKFQRGEPIE